MIQEQSSSHHPHHQQQLPSRYGGTGSATGVARASKKNKPKKIPQRGLGVAQLEKLRLEEQKKMMEGGGGGSVSVALQAPPHSRAHLLPPPPPPPVPLIPRPPPADGGAHCGFSPVLWDPAAADPMKHQYKRMPPLPMVSTGWSLTASSSHSHPTEPPSNQMYSSCSGSRSSAAPAPAEEDMESAGGVDRSWPFMFEGMTGAAAFRPTTGKAAPTTTVPFAFAADRVATREAAGFADACPPPDLMMSRHDFRATKYFSSANANYIEWSSPDLAYCKNSKANGEQQHAFLGLSAQQQPLTKQPPHLPEYRDFGLMKSQGSSSSIPAPASRPFYSFLPAGPVLCERPLGECRADVSEGVDLELKL